MKKLLFTILTAILCMVGYAQSVIDPLLAEEMERSGDEDRIPVVVIMKSQYDRMELTRRAAQFAIRADRREFVVNELKAFSEASQYDLRLTLSEMERGGMATDPTVLWMANALYFDATKAAVEALAMRNDIEIIGYAIERHWIPDGEEARPASATREITPNVTQVGADQVWALGYMGDGVVVAVIDTGVNYNHVDLAGHLWDGGEEFPHHGYDVINNDDDPMDDNGHGSHCSGTVCGDGHGASQTGMAPNATLMCVKCLDSNGNGGAQSISQGIQWAVEHGCDLFSMSLGIANSTVAERTLLRLTCEAALDAGVVAAIAAGNEGASQWQFPVPNNVRVPGSCPPPYLDEVQGANPGKLSCSVCIGAVDYNDNAAYFTSRGPVTWTNTEFGDYPYNPGIGLIRPDVCAPGVDIKSINYASNTGYTNMSGTSMATPCAAGCMALMLSKNINLSPEEVCRILEETAVPLAVGKSNTYGFGRINVLDAVNAVPSSLLQYNSFAINDLMGNNNHKLNPNESVSLSITLDNVSENPVSNVTLVLTTDNQDVSITNGEVQVAEFAANESLTIGDAFAFSVGDGVVAKQQIRFGLKVFVDGEQVSVFYFDVEVFDYLLQYATAVVLNDDNGLLEPGETADLRIIIDNCGNEMVQMLNGALSTEYEFVTLNETEKPFNTIGPDMMGYADFSVTLDEAAPEGVAIPFFLDLEDVHGRHNELDFSFKNSCRILFVLHDSGGNGWQGCYLRVSYSEGLPVEQITLEEGSEATFSRDVPSGSRLMLHWNNGQGASQCSFELVYEDGTVIFENSGGFSGNKLFTIDCANGSSAPELCHPVQNLSYTLDDHDVILTWDAPRDLLPVGYEVYRETVLLAFTEELTYTDPGLEDSTYNYCVYSVYEDCHSEFACLVAEVNSCAPVQNLDYTLDDDLSLTLTWDEPVFTAGLLEYQVYMDDELVGSTNELTYTFTLGTGQHDITLRAVFVNCELDSHVGVCVVGAVEGLDYLNTDGRFVHVLWTPISGISEYEVYVNGEWTETVEGNLYVAEFEAGLTTVTVKAVAEGCYVLGSSIDVCVIDPIEGFTFSDLDGEQMMRCSWNSVAYAEHYSVMVNGEAIGEQLTEPYYTFAPQVGANEVCVIATSVYGCFTWPYECATQMVYPAVNGFDYSFNGNQVSLSWNGDAPSYAIRLDDMEEEVVGTNTLTKEVADGDHLLTVVPIYPDGPAIPTQFMFTVTNLVTEIQVTEVHEGIMATAWTAVEGAVAYNLYRDGELMAGNLAATAYDDHEMPLNAVHCYSVQTVFEKGVSDLSDGACANYFQSVDENDGWVKVFPNPTSDKVTVECEGMTQIEVYSAEGKLVQRVKVEGDVCQIDGLESGVYMFRILKGEGVLTRKVVKR